MTSVSEERNEKEDAAIKYEMGQQDNPKESENVITLVIIIKDISLCAVIFICFKDY